MPEGLADVTAVSCGGRHTAVLVSTGEPRCWGNNENGQCDVPDGITNAVAISCGVAHTAVLLSTGAIL